MSLRSAAPCLVLLLQAWPLLAAEPSTIRSSKRMYFDATDTIVSVVRGTPVCVHCHHIEVFAEASAKPPLFSP